MLTHAVAGTKAMVTKMKKVTIQENQKGFLFVKGKLKGMLNAGTYRVFGDRALETVSMDAPVVSRQAPLERLLAREEIAREVITVEVEENHVALHYQDGVFAGVLSAGKHAFWKTYRNHTFTTVDVTDPRMENKMDPGLFARIPSTYYTKATVGAHEQGLLYLNRVFAGYLAPGTHYFWNNGIAVTVDTVDTRLLSLTVAGQELLTKDKVTLRISLVCNYRITDPLSLRTQVGDPEEQLRVAAQLALRSYVGNCRLDEILENKEALSAYVWESLKAREAELFLSVASAGVKDIILPGEIRDIMNTVLLAEKKAQANVITRREEVASTRSLLNTARLMEENATLYRLKEMEMVERICANVGEIRLSGQGDMLSQLLGLLQAPREEGSAT